MQDFKNLRVYHEAFLLSKKIFRMMDGARFSNRAKEQLLSSVSSICANLAEMSAFDTKNAKRHKLNVCIGEANETEFWLDLCHALDAMPEKEYGEFVSSLQNIRSMLCSLRASL